MSRQILFFLLIFCSSAFSQIKPAENRRVFSLPAGVQAKDYQPNTIIIKLKPVANSPTVKINSSSVGNVSVNLRSVTMRSLIPKFPRTGNISNVLNPAALSMEEGLSRIYELKFSGNARIEDVINEALADENVEYAEPAYIFHASYTPNDPLLTNAGQSYLSQVKAPEAWNINRSSSGVIIAVVDMGFDLLHQDLAANIYFNTGDPVNGIDDDHDGYIDNYTGWDLVGASGDNIKEDNDPGVKNNITSHGVHVSGLASAVSDNNIGVASIAFNAKIMGIKVGSDNDNSSIYRGYEGIKYAADHGAQIISCSWGGPAQGAYGRDIINYALAKGCLIIAAAGNDNVSKVDFPAAYEGVIAVANVNQADIKNAGSSFGTEVSISAPGTNILSTVNGSQYGTLSGTSMSVPIVASAAALVKGYFPLLPMKQVGERLRATSDYIDDKNPVYEGKLGKGRLNVYRALTESRPSIHYTHLAVKDKANGTNPAGDTIRVFFDLTNILDPVADLKVGLSSSSSYVTVLSPPLTVGQIVTDQTKTQVGPFLVYVNPLAPDNAEVLFSINYSATQPGFSDFEKFSIIVSQDYINISLNNITTTVSSIGRIGYSKPDANAGLGFLYKGSNLLYEASLMIGNSPDKVSNNARNGQGSDEHFAKRIKVFPVLNNSEAIETKSEFDDSANPNALDIKIRHRQLEFAKAPDDNYTIAEYEVINTSGALLKNIFIGLFTDWDVSNNNDITKYDAVNRLAYIFDKAGNSPFAGVKLLNTSFPPAYYPLSDAVQGDPLQNGEFTIAEKFKTLSSGVKPMSLGSSTEKGLDVAFVSGYGPFTIAADSSLKVAFALLAGDNLADLQNSATAAQTKYQQIAGASFNLASHMVLKQNYPNPVQDQTWIEFNIPESGLTALYLYDMMGRKIRTLVDGNLVAGAHRISLPVSGLTPGLYFYKLQFNSVSKTLKMLIQ